MTTNDTPPPSDNELPPPRDENDTGEAEQTALVRIDQSGLASIAKSEAMAQVDVAHQYPRGLLKDFERRAVDMATFDIVTAKLCMYTLERTEWDKKLKKRVRKDIVGPSIRLAEIVASTYRNIHCGSRPIDVGEQTVTVQGVAWDLENNTRVTVEVSRGIVGSGGKRYGNDMIIMTLNAAGAIARRNAVFSVVPRAFIARIFEKVRAVATGQGKPLQERREAMIAPFAKLGVDVARILARMDRSSVDELSQEDLEVLAGLWTRLKQGDPVDELFQAPAPKESTPVPGSAAGETGQRINLATGGKPAPAVTQPAAQVADKTDGVVTQEQPAGQPPASTEALKQEPKPAAPAAKKGANLSFGVAAPADDDRAAAAPTAEEMAKLEGQIK